MFSSGFGESCKVENPMSLSVEELSSLASAFSIWKLELMPGKAGIGCQEYNYIPLRAASALSDT
jgi:hypothetical protein